MCTWTETPLIPLLTQSCLLRYWVPPLKNDNCPVTQFISRIYQRHS